MPSESPIRTVSAEAADLQPWEMGGFFEYCERHRGPSVPWPQPGVFFGLARGVIPGILRLNRSIRRVWIPEYFCPEVAQSWSRVVQTVIYKDDPSLTEPAWRSLQPDRNDVVVAVNYFGVRDETAWKKWRSSSDCILLEDHTHDPVCAWAFESTADYVFSSLRKSLPITDGAICWSPRGLPLPVPSAKINPTAIELKFTAMLEKADFLGGDHIADLKGHYRELYASGDHALESGADSPISDRALRWIASGVPRKWRQVRESNVRNFFSFLDESPLVRPLFRDWPPNSTPFAAVLVFHGRTDRDECRAYLERNNVFCPVHWATDASAAAHDLSGRMLSVPADQRYSADDMAKVAVILNRWIFSKRSKTVLKSGTCGQS